METWDEYIAEQFVKYVSVTCTCDSEPEDCECDIMAFTKFSDSHWNELQDYWAETFCEERIS